MIMHWQRIAHLDPFLAGSLAARSWEPWDSTTPESEADSVGLAGERRDQFLRGWHDEMSEQDKARDPKDVLLREYDEMSKGYEKGDPAAR